jgi:hypothetical protein
MNIRNSSLMQQCIFRTFILVPNDSQWDTSFSLPQLENYSTLFCTDKKYKCPLMRMFIKQSHFFRTYVNKYCFTQEHNSNLFIVVSNVREEYASFCVHYSNFFEPLSGRIITVTEYKPLFMEIFVKNNRIFSITYFKRLLLYALPQFKPAYHSNVRFTEESIFFHAVYGGL